MENNGNFPILGFDKVTLISLSIIEKNFVWLKQTS